MTYYGMIVIGTTRHSSAAKFALKLVVVESERILLR